MPRAISGLVATLLLAGCVSTGNVGLVAKSGVNPAELISGSHPYQELTVADARVCRYFVLAVVPWGDSTFSKAVYQALDQSGGDALLNVTVSSSLFGFIPYYNLLSYTCTSVKGTAIRFLAADEEPTP